MKSLAIAYPNIAFIKYWGKQEGVPANLNLPANDSISMTKMGLSEEYYLQTHITIEFSPEFEEDFAILNDQILNNRDLERILRVINPMRKLKNIK